MKIEVKPFIKWVGGKSDLLNEIRMQYPTNFGKTITKYCEPFVGGGAVLFDVLSNYELEEIYISDINKELINLYRTIKFNVEDLLIILKKLKEEYMSLDYEEQKIYYYKKREKFNEYIIGKLENTIYGSALFIFLNKTCFNGLYRVNKKGLFNVPMGNYKNPAIYDEENLRNISKKLQKVSIQCAEYDKSFDFIDEKTLVYFDPPYRPLTKTSSFTSYNQVGFDDEAQIKLAKYYKKISDRGAFCILSNSDPKNTNDFDNFFDDLYKGYNINRIQCKRRVNSDSTKRGSVSELLITNNIKGEH